MLSRIVPYHAAPCRGSGYKGSSEDSDGAEDVENNDESVDEEDGSKDDEPGAGSLEKGEESDAEDGQSDAPVSEDDEALSGVGMDEDRRGGDSDGEADEQGGVDAVVVWRWAGRTAVRPTGVIGVLESASGVYGGGEIHRASIRKVIGERASCLSARGD